MTKTTINYENTVIYKIVCKDLGIKDCYVGHTTNFTQRKGQHKASCNNEDGNKSHYKVYMCIRENGGWDNWDMIEIEKFKCNDGNEARARERFQIESLEANLNVVIPTRTYKEYRESEGVKEILYERGKEWREENKEKLKETKHLDYINNTDKYKERAELRYKENKEKINTQRKQYREESKDYYFEKIDCECGGVYCRKHKSTHIKTNKHIAYLEKI
jgi:hypothetical protein